MPLAAAAIPAIIGAGATLYAGSQANKAADRQLAETGRATDAALALQREQYNTARNDYAPYRATGYAALDALAAQYGLNTAPATQTPGQGGSPAPGAPAGPAAGSPDLAAYRAQDPGIEAEFNRVRAQADPNSPQWQNLGLDSLDSWTERHFERQGRAEGRTMPTVQAAAPAPQPTQQEQAAPASQPPAQAPAPGMPAPYEAPAAPQMQQAATYERPNVDATVDRNQFFTPWDENDAGYRFQRDQTAAGVNNGFAARGLLRSGGAAKALQDRLAGVVGTYMNEDFNRKNVLYQSAINQAQFGANRSDRNFDADRSFGEGVRQFDNGFNRATFESDRGFGRNVFESDRANANNRQDTRTNDLFRLVGAGQGAVGASSAAGASYANNTGNALMGQANTASDVYGQRANNNASVFGNIAGMAQNYLANRGGGGSTDWGRRYDLGGGS